MAWQSQWGPRCDTCCLHWVKNNYLPFLLQLFQILLWTHLSQVLKALCYFRLELLVAVVSPGCPSTSTGKGSTWARSEMLCASQRSPSHLGLALMCAAVQWADDHEPRSSQEINNCSCACSLLPGCHGYLCISVALTGLTRQGKRYGPLNKQETPTFILLKVHTNLISFLLYS